MHRLILVLHGRTDWDKVNRIQGSVDVPLSEEGKTDAERIASDLAKVRIDAIYSSLLSRSYETAKTIAKNHNLKPKKIKELNEVNQGVWQGLCIGDIKKRYKKQYNLWKSSPILAKPPQGESMKEAYDRVVNTVHKILEKHSGSTVCIVSHEIVISLIKCHFKNENLENIWNMVPKNGSWELIEYL